MTTDPQDWFLIGQALDHHATVEALQQAMDSTDVVFSGLAEPLAVALAQAGYALVPVDTTPRPDTLAHDLTRAMEAGFLARKQD